MYDHKHVQSIAFLIIQGIHFCAMTSRQMHVEGQTDFEQTSRVQ